MFPTFLHPWTFLLLLVIPGLAWLARRTQRRKRQMLALMTGGFPSPKFLSDRSRWVRRLGFYLGLALLVGGIAGPRWGRDWSQSTARGRDLFLVIDQSRSMYAEAPSRLDRACAALLNLVEALRLQGGNRVGLVGFAGKAQVICPLTHDLDHVVEALAAIDREVPDPSLGQGTRIGAGLALAVESFQGRPTSSWEVLLISDGDDPARDGEWQVGIDAARQAGIAVDVLGVGDAFEERRIPDGVGWLTHQGKEVRTRLQVAPLRAIADATGGVVLAEIDRGIPFGDRYLHLVAGRGLAEDSPDTLPVLRQRQAWLLLPALLLLTLPFVFPWRGPA
ncbi:MAG: VWA domain-containing protein [Gemmataceae bacterium]